MELLAQQNSACGSGCGGHAAGTPGKKGWVMGAIVLVAAGALLVQAVTKSDAASPQPSATAVADPVASPAAAGTDSPGNDSGAASPVAETSVGTTIGAFSELNVAAAKTDAVFIFVPGKDGDAASLPSAAIKAAVRSLESKGLKCGLFTLKAGTRDYDQVAAQMSLPSVLAMANGRGISVVTGNITEAKLVQGFVAACSPGGCGGGSCAPGAPGCK